MGEDWSRWLDEAPAEGESASRPTRTRAPVVRLRRGKRAESGAEAVEPAQRPILVVGGCGGAGTTTTVLGIAGELALGVILRSRWTRQRRAVISRCAAPTSTCTRSACNRGCTAVATTSRRR